MKYIILPLLAFIYTSVVIGQNSFRAIVSDKDTKEPIVGVSVILKDQNRGGHTDINGRVTINNIADGRYAILFRFIGYKEKTDSFSFPLPKDTPQRIYLTQESAEFNEIVISSTRSSRTIQNIPTRVEFISQEELNEKANMKPGDIKMLLSESTGIQMQQTSATTANADIRIQGLDGRYTQILKDGFPLYSGFSGGLSIMQIPPLDLKQVEIIKGSASTLYGGGAIAGLINLVSKVPSDKKELTLLVNGTSAKGVDISGFYSEKFKRIGITAFAARNSNAPYDPGSTGLTAIPQFQRYTFNPRIFFYLSQKTTLDFSINAIHENRIGGDTRYINGERDSSHYYFEKNISKRSSEQLRFEHRFTDSSKIVFKSSLSYFDRSLSIPNYLFSGTQLSSFNELTYQIRRKKNELVLGTDLYTDKFNERRDSAIEKRSYLLQTAGLFINNTWDVASFLHVETGLRGDYVKKYGFFTLPRLAVLFTISPKLTSRISGGLGYKAPTIFTEQAEEVQYRQLQPISDAKAETSIGGSFDFNYRTTLANDKVSLSINQMFFYTKLDNPLLLSQDTKGIRRLYNANGHFDTKGVETNIKIGYDDFKLYLGYTFTDAREHINGIYSDYPLTPKHRVNAILMYEIENQWKIGLESYYFSPQKLSDGATGRDYWLCGFMVEKMWSRFSVYINFENLLNIRQTAFDRIYTGPITNPVFRDIYAPIDGFVVNAGAKIKLWQ